MDWASSRVDLKMVKWEFPFLQTKELHLAQGEALTFSSAIVLNETDFSVNNQT